MQGGWAGLRSYVFTLKLHERGQRKEAAIDRGQKKQVYEESKVQKGEALGATYLHNKLNGQLGRAPSIIRT